MLRMPAQNVARVLFGSKNKFVVTGGHGSRRVHVWDGAPREFDAKSKGQLQFPGDFVSYVNDVFVITDPAPWLPGCYVVARPRGTAWRILFDEVGDVAATVRGIPIGGGRILLAGGTPAPHGDLRFVIVNIADVDPSVDDDQHNHVTVHASCPRYFVYGSPFRPSPIRFNKATGEHSHGPTVGWIHHAVGDGFLFSKFGDNDGLFLYTTDGAVVPLPGLDYHVKDIRDSLYLACSQETVTVGRLGGPKRSYKFGMRVNNGVIAPDGLSAYVWSGRELAQFDIDL